MDDVEGQLWLEYEYMGYPNTQAGMPPLAWEIAKKHGRYFQREGGDGKIHEHVFLNRCNELEKEIDNHQTAIKCFSTQREAISGNPAYSAASNMTNLIAGKIAFHFNAIENSEGKLYLLKMQYYTYASDKKTQLLFGKITNSIFEDYQNKVDSYFSALPETALQKKGAIEDIVEGDNSERYAQVLTSCRRLWSEMAKHLFSEVFPNYQGTKYKTLSGEEKDISGDHDNNKLFAVIEELQKKAPKNTLIGSGIEYLIDWLEQINKRQNAGVHDNVSKEEAVRCIIHTYIALGDILSLKATVEQKKQTEPKNVEPQKPVEAQQPEA